MEKTPSVIAERLAQQALFLSGGDSANGLRWDPDSNWFPSRKHLPTIPGAPQGAAWVWGKDDYVSASAVSQRTGHIVLGTYKRSSSAWAAKSFDPEACESCCCRDQDGRDRAAKVWIAFSPQSAIQIKTAR
jgi:hypothetical protein